MQNNYEDIDPWEYQYIQNLKNKHLLCWSDNYAFYKYPKYSHIYDKYWLGKTLGAIKTWDLEKEIPDQYPVVVKPKINLFGLSKDCYIANIEEEIEDIQGMIAQEYVEGTHYTTDYVLNKGKIIDSFTFIGHKNFYNDFILWESVPFPDKITQYVKNLFHNYTGIVNVESIDSKPIEAHLRGSLQFYDICAGLLEQMPLYIHTGRYKPVSFEKTYSKVLRTKHDGYLSIKKLPNKPKEIRSLQIMPTTVKLSECDPSSFRKRFMIINGTNLDIINNFTKTLIGNLCIKSRK